MVLCIMLAVGVLVVVIMQMRTFDIHAATLIGRTLSHRKETLIDNIYRYSLAVTLSIQRMQ